MLSVAIQGLRGSFHDEAAHRLLPDTSLTLVECDNFHDVFATVVAGRADFGVCAIENSLHGSINPVYRLFERHTVWITREVTLQIKQYLIGIQATPATSLAAVGNQVLSQSPALAQCELWLDAHMPHAKRIETNDTAGSVRYVVTSGDKSQFAIAGKRAAIEYGGTIVAGPINDDPHNYTRFVLLQRAAAAAPDATRTSIIVKTDHSPGSLYRALGVFEQLSINLSKLDSHPIPTDKRHYAFYIDFDAGIDHPNAQLALQKLRDIGCTIKVLGSYTTAV